MQAPQLPQPDKQASPQRDPGGLGNRYAESRVRRSHNSVLARVMAQIASVAHARLDQSFLTSRAREARSV